LKPITPYKQRVKTQTKKFNMKEEKNNEKTVMYDFGPDYGDEPVRLWK
jgi:hypothetical protein